MPGKQERRQSEQWTILSRNKKIDKKTVAAHTRLERELKSLGVEIKPEFGIEPPLGGTRRRPYNRNF